MKNIETGEEIELFRDSAQTALEPFTDSPLIVGSKPPVLSGNGSVAKIIGPDPASNARGQLGVGEGCLYRANRLSLEMNDQSFSGPTILSLPFAQLISKIRVQG